MLEQQITTEAEFRATKKWLKELRGVHERMRSDPDLPFIFRIYLWPQINEMRRHVRAWGINNQKRPDGKV